MEWLRIIIAVGIVLTVLIFISFVLYEFRNDIDGGLNEVIDEIEEKFKE